MLGSFVWHVRAAPVVSDAAIEACLMFVAGARLVILTALLNFVFVHLFVVPVLSTRQRLRATACGIRPVGHVLLVTLRAFASACTTNIRLIVFALSFSASCDWFSGPCLN